MSKVTLEIDSRQVAAMIGRLPLEEKVILARRLAIETWQARFKNLVSRIDGRLKRRRVIPDEKIIRIVKRVRKRSYAQSHH